VDIGGLYDCLAGIYEGKADPSILDIYSDVRREKYQTIVDPISQSNIRRLFDQDPDKALETDEFLQLLKSIEGNVDAQREFLRSPNALKYDFTQHYRDANPQPRTNGEEKNPAIQVNAVAEIGTA
jgi:hypothetical protein